MNSTSAGSGGNHATPWHNANETRHALVKKQPSIFVILSHICLMTQLQNDTILCYGTSYNKMS